MTINRVRSRTGELNALPFVQEETSMKLVLTLIGVVLLVIAAVYFVLPADQLPGFFPGHETGVAPMHYKHGLASGIVGRVLLAARGLMGRRVGSEAWPRP